MQILVKRNDKILGFKNVAVTVKAYSSGTNVLSEKLLSNEGHVHFNIEARSVDVVCSVGDEVIREWRGLNSDKKIILELWLKNSNTGLPGYTPVEAKSGNDEGNAAPHDASQVIDRNKQYTGLGLMAISMIFGFGGYAILTSDGPEPVGWGLLMVAAAIFVYALIIHEQSGANDSRCKKCNSNKLVMVKSDERFMGTYSKQESVYDYKNGGYSMTRVIKSDFEVIEKWKCQLCNHSWVHQYTRTTDSN